MVRQPRRRLSSGPWRECKPCPTPPGPYPKPSPRRGWPVLGTAALAGPLTTACCSLPFEAGPVEAAPAWPLAADGGAVAHAICLHFLQAAGKSTREPMGE